jgi:hypothetical protein
MHAAVAAATVPRYDFYYTALSRGHYRIIIIYHRYIIIVIILTARSLLIQCIGTR